MNWAFCERCSSESTGCFRGFSSQTESLVGERCSSVTQECKSACIARMNSPRERCSNRPSTMLATTLIDCVFRALQF
eukprot:7177460-Lingulodinium_polyedra.AAC.1